MSAKIKKGDRVIVTTGRDKGKKGEVMKVFPKENRALVSGVNTVKRHQRQTQKQQGGIVSKESAGATVEPRPCRSQVGRGDADRLEDTGRRAARAVCQEVR